MIRNFNYGINNVNRFSLIPRRLVTETYITHNYEEQIAGIIVKLEKLIDHYKYKIKYSYLRYPAISKENESVFNDISKELQFLKSTSNAYQTYLNQNTSIAHDLDCLQIKIFSIKNGLGKQINDTINKATQILSMQTIF